MLNKLTKILLTVIIAYTVMWAQTDKNKIIVAKYDNQNITLKEFEKAFLKNAGSVDKAKKAKIKEYQNFLRLYVNYKMKLADAEKRGLNNDPSITKELNEYKESIASSFLIEKRLIEPAIKKLYDKRKLEYRVSHIMFIPQKGKEDSTFKMAQTVLKSIKNGIDFETLAKKYSQDQNSAKEGGDIYYITAGFLPVTFENAVYSLKIGQVYPKVVKTRYGFHIIKVTDIRERVPEIRASHILISFANKGKIDSAGSLKQAKLILDSLKHGGKFEDLAKKFSNDTGSKEKGGDLGFFKRRRMVKPFDEAAFNLKNVGDISDIVKSKYGYHIIKLTGKLSMPTFEKDRENLVKLFKKNRYDQALNELSEQLQKKYKYDFKTTNFVKLVKSSDTLKVGETNKTLNKIKNLPIFTFKNKSYSIGQVLNLIKDKKENKNKKMSSNFLSIEIDKIAKDKALELEASRLEKLNPQFADLMKEYKKGLLIFRLQQEEVWNNIKSDSVSLRDYFNKNRKRFKGNIRFGSRCYFAFRYGRKNYRG